MIVRSIGIALTMSLLLSLSACVGQDGKSGSSAKAHSIPLALWVEDVVENDTNETAQPVEIADSEIADNEDATTFDHYFSK